MMTDLKFLCEDEGASSIHVESIQTLNTADQSREMLFVVEHTPTTQDK